MIRFQLDIRNYFPYSRNIKQIDYFVFDRKVSKNRAFETQFSKWSKDYLFRFILDLNWKYNDHAGPEIEIEILGFYFTVKLYSIHHWNYEESRWYKEGENEGY